MSEIDYDALAAKVNEKVNSNVKEVTDGVKTIIEEKLSKVDEKLDAFSAKLSQKETIIDDNDDDDTFFTKKEVEEIVVEKLKGQKVDVNEVVNKAMNEMTLRQQKNFETFQDFPMLNPQSPVYDKEFYTEVDRETKKRVSAGRDDKDPELLYDVAATVFAKNPKYMKLRKESIEEEQRKLNNQEDSFSISGRQKNSTEPSKDQLSMASRYGLSGESLTEYMKKPTL